jgi:hypothetical protein
MKLIAEQLIAEHLSLAHQFERLAAHETDPKVKKQFEEQAEAYHRLAAKRAQDIGLAPPIAPAIPDDAT